MRGLADEAGMEDPSDDDLRRFDRNRPGKKTSNKEWESPTDPGCTHHEDEGISPYHLAYKAQHAVDVDTEIVVVATIHHAGPARFRGDEGSDRGDERRGCSVPALTSSPTR
ncbi:MAG: hypothetical protein U1E73_05375 [Planctomycetota bacterium]